MLTNRYYNPGTYCNQLATEEMRSDLDLRSDLKLGYTSCAYSDQLFVTRYVKNRVWKSELACCCTNQIAQESKFTFIHNHR